MNKEAFVSVIESFLPDNTVDAVASWLFKKPVQLKIVNDRRTKLGDFRANRPIKGHHIITINGGLNKFEFLVTLIHEFAHLDVYEEFGRSIRPHGEEWKDKYRELMIEYFELDVFPRELAIVLLRHLRNPKASSNGDLNLVRALAVYDDNVEDGSVYLEDLEDGDSFFINGKILKKGEKRRTRYMCTEHNGRRRFTVSALAKVIKY